MSDIGSDHNGISGQIIDITERLTRVPVLKGGSGDGTSGGMESRIARLESDMEHVKKAIDKIDRGQEDARKSIANVKDDIGTLRTEFGRFDERSKQFPTKGFIFTVSASLLAAGSAVMAILIKILV